ncbi:MAG: ABC transporter substrate-binding protein [Phaeodactylibacter sp.]|nr:ABC transporter substrate-binding protein [Phaeodactylibacter sp.]
MQVYQSTTNNREKNINIAVLYASSDVSFWQELEKHITLLLKIHANVRIWTVKDVELGMEVSATVREELEQADVTLLLLSADFAYEEVFDDETRILLDHYARQKSGKRFILPVIVRDYIWRTHFDRHYDIEKLKVFDEIAEEPENRERVYRQVTELLGQYIEELNAQSIQFSIPTWVGYLGGIMYNDGFVKNRTTDLYKKFGRTLRFELNDEIEEVCKAWRSGEADLIWSTIDRLPQVLNQMKELRPKVIFQASWSNGADAVIARNGICSLEELRGKKVIYPYETPAHTFLKYVMKEAGLDTFDIVHLPQKIADLDLITKTFIADKSIDAMTIWSPYLEVCLNEVPDAEIIAHTGDHPNLIADVVLASEDYIDLNREELVEFFSGWCREISRFTLDPFYRQGGMGILVDAIIRPLPSIIPSKIRDSLVEALTTYFSSSLEKVHLCSYNDNLRFFGIPGAEVIPGQLLYNRFLELQFKEFQHLPDMQWEQFIDTSIIENIRLEE